MLYHVFICMEKVLANNYSFNPENNYLKENRKFQICWGLIKLDRKFQTDLKFSEFDYHIDVYDMTENIVYIIILDSERGKYPKYVSSKYFNVVLEKIKLPTPQQRFGLSRRRG